MAPTWAVPGLFFLNKRRFLKNQNQTIAYKLYVTMGIFSGGIVRCYTFGFARRDRSSLTDYLC